LATQATRAEGRALDGVERLSSVQTTNGLINVLSAASDQLYRDLTSAQVNQLRSHQGEMVAQTLGTGGLYGAWRTQTVQPPMRATSRGG